MKTRALILVFILTTIFISCTTTKYVPIESIKTEYINKIEKDTLLIKDSIYHKDKGDTIYIERYKTIYKNKIKNDTIIINDTIPIIQEVEVIKEVNRIKDWQLILMLLGGGMIAIVGYKIITKLWLR